MPQQKNGSADGAFAKLFAEQLAEFPDKTDAEHWHTLELKHDVRMGPPERRALWEQVKEEQAKQVSDAPTFDTETDDHEVDDTDAEKATYDYEPDEDGAPFLAISEGERFTGPGVEGNLKDFEAPTPPGKSAGHQKLDQLTTERTDQHEQPAPAGEKSNNMMSEKIEAPASNGGPQEKIIYEQQHYKVKDEAGKAESPPPGTDEGQKYPDTNGRDPWPGASDEDAERMAVLFAGNEVEHVHYSDPEPERHGRNGVKFRPSYKTVPGAVTVEHWQQHLAGDHPLGIIPIREGNLCLFGSADLDEYSDENPLQVIQKIESAELPLVPTRSKSGGLHLNLFVREWTPAADLQVVLKGLAAQLGLDLKKVEIFPKQTELKSDGSGGNCITVPYAGTTFNEKMCNQAGLKKSGAEMTLREFLNYAEERRVGPEEFAERVKEARSRKANGHAGAGSGAPPDPVWVPRAPKSCWRNSRRSCPRWRTAPGATTT